MNRKLKKEIKVLRNKTDFMKEVMPKKPLNEPPFRYSEWLKIKHPKYYNDVMEMINCLGSLTVIYGHSNKMDIIKDCVYRLIKL